MSHGCPDGCECNQTKIVASCCNGTAGCTGAGEKHWCETSAQIQSRIKYDADYTEGLRKALDNAKGSADHRALVIGDLTRKLESEKKRSEALEMVASCAKDVVDYWPQFSFKTIRIMMAKMENLKQALAMLK